MIDQLIPINRHCIEYIPGEICSSDSSSFQSGSCCCGDGHTCADSWEFLKEKIVIETKSC